MWRQGIAPVVSTARILAPDLFPNRKFSEIPILGPAALCRAADPDSIQNPFEFIFRHREPWPDTSKRVYWKCGWPAYTKPTRRQPYLERLSPDRHMGLRGAHPNANRNCPRPGWFIPPFCFLSRRHVTPSFRGRPPRTWKLSHHATLEKRRCWIVTEGAHSSA